MGLQLVDMRRPMRPLSILEYWLDNVMAAVPALAVCGHVDGMVKGYQVLKTEPLEPSEPPLSLFDEPPLTMCVSLINRRAGAQDGGPAALAGRVV